MTAHLTRAMDTALELADWASNRILVRPEHIESKKHAADHVTETDREVEQHVRAVLEQRFPDHSIVGEEYGGEAGDQTWYLDPVDGTTNYANGLQWSSFSLAFYDGDGGAVGVVADPYRGEVFSAVRGGPALLNGEPIRCRDSADLAGEIMTTEWASYLPWFGMEGLVQGLAARQCSVRIMGSTALSLVNVAAGRVAGCVIGTYHAIDGLASSIIATQAGAVALDEDHNETVFPKQGGILVAAPGVADAIFELWRGSVSSGGETA